MISIRKYLQGERQTEGALLSLALLLIEAMDRHAVEGAPEELARFQECTRELIGALGSHAPPAELLASAERAVEALRQYNLHVVEYWKRPVADLQAKVKLLTAAITAVSSASQENILRLREIKGQVLGSMEVKDIRSLRTRLAECLDGVLAEAEKHRAETDRAALELIRPSSRQAQREQSGEPVRKDPSTGLPVRVEAEAAIAQACQEDAPAFVVVMVINRVQTLNRSFGEQFGEVILGRFSEFVQQQLLPVDQLFRWSGPTVVALIRRKSTLDVVRGAIDTLLAPRLQHTVNTITREVQMPISARWTVLPLMTSPRLLFHKIDGFAGFE